MNLQKYPYQSHHTLNSYQLHKAKITAAPVKRPTSPNNMAAAMSLTPARLDGYFCEMLDDIARKSIPTCCVICRQRLEGYIWLLLWEKTRAGSPQGPGAATPNHMHHGGWTRMCHVTRLPRFHHPSARITNEVRNQPIRQLNTLEEETH